MRILLDTHVFLWFLQNAPQLSTAAKALIEDPANHKFVSVVSCWELAIKAGLGKFKFTESVHDLLSRELRQNAFDLLPITLGHATSVEALPHHHRDPFDRLLIAQAMIENLPLVSADAMFDRDGVRRLW
jgi:PIN domain nuclease of toxin-antitoxin system